METRSLKQLLGHARVDEQVSGSAANGRLLLEDADGGLMSSIVRMAAGTYDWASEHTAKGKTGA